MNLSRTLLNAFFSPHPFLACARQFGHVVCSFCSFCSIIIIIFSFCKCSCITVVIFRRLHNHDDRRDNVNAIHDPGGGQGVV